MKLEKVETVGGAAIWAATDREGSTSFGVVFGRNDDVAFEPTWGEVAWYRDLEQVRVFVAP